VIAYEERGIDLDLGERLGLLIPMEQTMRISCRECGGSNSMLSTYMDRKGNEGYMMHCIECGMAIVPNSEVRRWRVHCGELARRFAKTAKIFGVITPLLDDQVWHLGRRGNHSYLFARYAGDRTFDAMIALLKQYPKATIVTPSGGLAARFQSLLPNRFVAMELSVTLQGDGAMLIDDSALEESKPESAKPPRKKRGERTAKIELLEHVMKEHVFAAYDYMLDTAGRGEVKLLPRPQQELLAKMTNMNQQDVSRCLKDSGAKILRLLWEQSLTLDGIESLARMFRR